ncbi:MAG: hypothetical protein IT337_11505, partial [Thermomicrobiales bacterium]|nr:hypothetical protein [Thermomicrobiales bacterium]
MTENSTLLSQMTVMTGLCGFIVNLQLGWLGVYLKAVLLTGAALLWLELHAQWPAPLRVMSGAGTVPRRRLRDYSWRFVVFAYLMPISLLLFIVWAIARSPEIVVP